MKLETTDNGTVLVIDNKPLFKLVGSSVQTFDGYHRIDSLRLAEIMKLLNRANMTGRFDDPEEFRPYTKEEAYQRLQPGIRLLSLEDHKFEVKISSLIFHESQDWSIRIFGNTRSWFAHGTLGSFTHLDGTKCGVKAITSR